MCLYFQPNQDPYCFVEFYDHESAAAALAAMNKRMCLGRVSWRCRNVALHETFLCFSLCWWMLSNNHWICLYNNGKNCYGQKSRHFMSFYSFSDLLFFASLRIFCCCTFFSLFLCSPWSSMFTGREPGFLKTDTAWVIFLVPFLLLLLSMYFFYLIPCVASFRENTAISCFLMLHFVMLFVQESVFS